MAALARVLANDGRGEPESRLLWAAGKDTMMACFHIGVYSDRELLGQGLSCAVEVVPFRFLINHDSSSSAIFLELELEPELEPK